MAVFFTRNDYLMFKGIKFCWMQILSSANLTVDRKQQICKLYSWLKNMHTVVCLCVAVQVWLRLFSESPVLSVISLMSLFAHLFSACWTLRWNVRKYWKGCRIIVDKFRLLVLWKSMCVTKLKMNHEPKQPWYLHQGMSKCHMPWNSLQWQIWVIFLWEWC